MIFEIELDNQRHRADIVRRDNAYFLRLDGGPEQQLDASFPEPGIVQFLLNGRSFAFNVSGANGDLTIERHGRAVSLQVRDPRSLRSRRAGAGGEAGPKKLTAPMPGKVVRILAAAGDHVESGAGVIVIEAMKMQNELKAPKSGTVKSIAVNEGDTVNPGDTLVIVE